MDKTLYKCDICGEICLTDGEFVVHRMKHTGSKAPHKCKLCDSAFWDLVTLLCHEQTHGKDKPYKCNICEKSFSMAAGLICHTRTHTGERPYVCDVCQKTFTQSGHLQRHKRIHTGVKPYICDICQNGYVDLSTLIRHRRTHTGEKPYHCDICNKSFTQSSNFVFHKRIHTGERPYLCDVCGKTFVRSCDLLCHKRTHTGEKPYTCETCNKSFSKSSSLVDHERTHTGQKPYLCDTCGKSFVTSSHLVTHKRIHTGEKPYKCEICQKKFTTSSALVCHKRIHTGDKPYQCDLCEKRFCQLSHVWSHKRRNHGVQPHKCDICGETFTVSSNLLHHKQMHSQESVFLCDICGKALPDSNTLACHKILHTQETIDCDIPVVESTHSSEAFRESGDHGISSSAYQTRKSDSHNGTPTSVRQQIKKRYVERKDKVALSDNEQQNTSKLAESYHSEGERRENTNRTFVCSQCGARFQTQLQVKSHVCGKKFHSLSLLERKITEIIQKKNAKSVESAIDKHDKQKIEFEDFNSTVTKTTSHDADLNGLALEEEHDNKHDDDVRKFDGKIMSMYDENHNRSADFHHELETSQSFTDTTFVCSQCSLCFNSISLLEKHNCAGKRVICKNENVNKQCMHTKNKEQCSNMEEPVDDKDLTPCVCSQCGFLLVF